MKGNILNNKELYKSRYHCKIRGLREAAEGGGEFT